MSILAWIIVGLIAGWLAGLVMRGGGYGVLGDIILGIIGALLGGFIGAALFGVPTNSGVNLTTLFWAFIGAVIVVALSRAFRRSRI